MSASPAVVNQPTPQQRRTTILAASVGTVIEWYDYMAYAFVAVTLAAVFFPAADTATAVLSALAVFGVSFLFRPLGGVVFGHIADKFGRRPALTISAVAAGSVIISGTARTATPSMSAWSSWLTSQQSRIPVPRRAP